MLRKTRGENGVSKKKGGKEPSRQKKKRMERAVGKAEAVMEKLDKKRGESVKRGKVVKDRRVGFFFFFSGWWDGSEANRVVVGWVGCVE